MMKNKVTIRKIYRIKYRPSSFLVYGLLLYFVVFLINPYKYTIYSVEGVLYFFIAYSFLVIGAFMMESLVRHRKSRNVKILYEVIISKKAELFIQLISLLAIGFFIVYFHDVVSLSTSQYNFASEDLRLALSDNRSFINKVAEMGMQIGPVAYLIISNTTKLNYRSTYLLSLIAFFAPTIGILSVGARGSAVIGLFVFIINNLLQKRRGRKYFESKKILKKILPYAIFLAIVYLIYSLFISRPGLSTSENLHLIYPGDMKLKGFYKNLNQILNYKLDPLYKLFMYYTHSFPTFTYFYVNAPAHGVFYGVLQFSLLFFVLNALGIVNVNPNMVVGYNPTAGLYSTFVSYFILDYGKVLGLVAILISGMFLGVFYRSNLKGKFGYFIYPVILTMALISPIYYFWSVGRMNVILAWYCILYPIIKLLGLKTIQIM